MKRPGEYTALSTVLRTAFVTSAIVLSSFSVAAADWDHDVPPDRDHPLRIVHYFVAPVGELLDWALIRPMARVGEVIAPYHHIDARGFSGCSRERPARSCTDVVR
jgi:hypothetical protein